MYPSAGGFGRGGGNWLEGGTNWTVDYPRGDRTFAVAIRRLTRVDVRSVEQPVNPDDGDEIFYWPYLHVGMPTNWNLTPAQAVKIREYLLRGGFMFATASSAPANGKASWSACAPSSLIARSSTSPRKTPSFTPPMTSRSAIRSPISAPCCATEIPTGPMAAALLARIRDDKGRVMVAITFNNDLGDSWQLADDPRYPQKYSFLGIRLGVNFVIYTMTH